LGLLSREVKVSQNILTLMQRVTMDKDLLVDLFMVRDCDVHGSTTVFGFGLVEMVV